MIDLNIFLIQTGEAAAELSSSLEKLNKKLECLREDQKKEHHSMEKALEQLSTFVTRHSAKPVTKRMMDVGVQTSPAQEHPVSDVLHGSKREATQLTRVSNNFACNQSKALPKKQRPTARKRKVPPRSQNHSRKPLVMSQRNQRVVADENHRPEKNHNKQAKTFACRKRTIQELVSPDCLKHLTGGRSEGRGCSVSPLRCWSQDGAGSLCVPQTEATMEKLPSAGSWFRTQGSPGGLWQWFDMNSDSDF